MTGFDGLCSLLNAVHDQPFSSQTAEKLTEFWTNDEDSLRKAILIDQLASLETRAWKCRAAAAYRTQLSPVFKGFITKETFAPLLEGAHHLRYAAVKWLLVVILTNDDLGVTASNILSTIRTAHKLLCCRRTLRFLCKKDSDDACPSCGYPRLRDSRLDQISSIALLIRIWSSCLKDGLSDSSMDDTLDLLVTSHDMITAELTKVQAINTVTTSWSAVYGKPILDLLLSSDRLVVRHVLELLHAVLATALHDLSSRQYDWTVMDVVAMDILTKLDSDATSSSLDKAATAEVWFGGPVGSDGNNDPVDLNVVRLRLLLPVMSKAILVSFRSAATRNEGSIDSLFSNIDLSDSHRLVSILVDQDDHFCDFFLSCVVVYKSHPDFRFNPHQLWLHFLNHVSWSDEVVIDWLTSSETVFLFAFVQYLKLINHDRSRFYAVCDHFPVASFTSASGDAKISRLEITESHRFQILEIIGDQERQREVILKPLRHGRSEDDTTPSFTFSNITDKLHKFFQELATKLERMHKKNLIGFNVQPLLNLLGRVNRTK